MSKTSRAEIVALLAPTLGDDKSDEVVRAALRALGVTSDELSLQQANALLDDLANGEGLVAVAARFARRRIRARILEEEMANIDTSMEPAPVENPLRRSAIRGSKTVTASDLMHLLSATVGEEKSEEAVSRAMRERGLSANARLSKDDALAVLEAIARNEGIVGVTARFAKARLLLLVS